MLLLIFGRDPLFIITLRNSKETEINPDSHRRTPAAVPNTISVRVFLDEIVFRSRGDDFFDELATTFQDGVRHAARIQADSA